MADLLISGDCVVEIPKLEAESVDLIVTDPPYGLEFMGKAWDAPWKDGAGFSKPGIGERETPWPSFTGSSDEFGGANPTCSICGGRLRGAKKCHCEKPDWKVKGEKPNPRYRRSLQLKGLQAWATRWGKECLRVLKPGAFAFVMCSPRSDLQSRMALALEDAGFNTAFTPIYWAYASGFPKATNISKAVDKENGLTREVTGKKRFERSPYRADGIIGGSDPNPMNWEKKKKESAWLETVPSHPQAKVLDGSYAGFQPKPAVEVILVAMKPLSEHTYVEQALKNGKGVTWLDSARIPFQNEDDRGDPERFISDNLRPFSPESGWNQNDMKADRSVSDKGRFPANILVSDDALNDGRTWEGKKGYDATSGDTLYELGMTKPKITRDSGVSEHGSFSRYFSLDAWWGEKVKALPKSVQKTFPFLIVPKAGKRERNNGLETFAKVKASNGDKFTDVERRKEGHGPSVRERQNYHPTVKPLKLMSYLITLGSRPRDVVLDPFVGSGTTCIAAKMLGRKGIGIEIDEEYLKIARARVKSIEQALL